MNIFADVPRRDRQREPSLCVSVKLTVRVYSKLGSDYGRRPGLDTASPNETPADDCASIDVPFLSLPDESWMIAASTPTPVHLHSLPAFTPLRFTNLHALPRWFPSSGE